MKRILTLLSVVFFMGFSSRAQYYHIPYPNANTNPGGLNTDFEYPVGGGLPAGWTTTFGPAAVPTWSAVQTLPFTFMFDGMPVTSYKVSNSGCVTFDVATLVPPPSFTAVAIPSATVPDKSVCALGLRGTGANDNVVTKTFGTAPNRQFWISFNSYSNANANDYLYYSIVLEETSNKIFIADQRTSGTASMSLGVQVNAATGWSVAGSPAVPSLTSANFDVTDNTYYAFIPGVQVAYDMTVNSITTSAYLVAGNNSITGVIRNLGATTITSFDLNYAIDGGAPVTTTVNAVNIPSLTTYNFTHPTPWNAAIGPHTIDVWATNLNGANADANTGDDHKIKSVSVLSENIQRLPLFEVFTSSTCGPCKPGNTNFHNIIDPKPQGDFVYVKFQQDFPGSGDPYCTTESINRRNYYGINSIPRMEIDGGWDGNASSFTQALYDEAVAIPAYYKMNGTYGVDNKTVSAKVKFSPLFTPPAGSKLFVAVLERKTTANVATNGETEFLQVMKKMLPTENGTAIPNVAIGNWDSLSLSYTFKGNYRLPADGQAANIINNNTENSVEEFTDLMVIAWIQGADKTVYQALNLASITPVGTENFTAAINKIEVYPNPVSDILRVNIDAKESEQVFISLADISGNIVLNNTAKIASGKNSIQMDIHSLATGIYHLMIFDSKNNSSVHKIVVQR